jgi:hypothetical protein
MTLSEPPEEHQIVLKIVFVGLLCGLVATAVLYTLQTMVETMLRMLP